MTIMRMTDQEVQDVCWSDLHKDVYGCRPGSHLPNPTREEYDDLVRRLDVEMEYDRRADIQAQHAFERNVEYLVRGQCGMTRLEAVRAVVNKAISPKEDAYRVPWDVTDRSAMIDDWGYVCYCLNVAYDLEEQIRLQYLGEI